MYVDRRLLRTKFLPLFCSGVVRLAHRKCEVMAQYLVQTAYEGFKVQLPKRKIPPCKTGEKFCRVKQRQNESGVLRGGKFFCGLSLTEVVGLTVITNHFLWLCSK